MLVLARSVGQSVVLDDRVTVTVVEARGGLVRLGIEAPDDVGVRRGELAPRETEGSDGSVRGCGQRGRRRVTASVDADREDTGLGR